MRISDWSSDVCSSDLKRSGKRLLTVGTDCALGKKYTALALHRAFVARGIDADFRATGQTGIMIAGGGMPMDAVVSDFEAGRSEGHTSELQSLMRSSYAVVCLEQKIASTPVTDTPPVCRCTHAGDKCELLVIHNNAHVCN